MTLYASLNTNNFALYFSYPNQRLPQALCVCFCSLWLFLTLALFDPRGAASPLPLLVCVASLR